MKMATTKGGSWNGSFLFTITPILLSISSTSLPMISHGASPIEVSHFVSFSFKVLFLVDSCFFLLISFGLVWFCVGILVKGMYELWGVGSDYEELQESIRNFPEERKSPYLQQGSTFKISVESFGKAISFQEQNERIQGLAYIPFKV